MQFILLAVLTFLMVPVASTLIGGILFALVQNPLMWFVMVGGILCVGGLCR